jgi:hypothetical protein
VLNDERMINAVEKIVDDMVAVKNGSRIYFVAMAEAQLTRATSLPQNFRRFYTTGMHCLPRPCIAILLT